MKNNLKKYSFFLSNTKAIFWKFKMNKVYCNISNKRKCTNLKTPDLINKNKQETNSILNDIENLNFRKDKLYKKNDLEILKQNIISLIQDDKGNDQNKDEIERKLHSIQNLLINYENYSKFIELSQISETNQYLNKNSHRKIEIIKKDDRLIINLNDLTKKNIYLGVILNKRIRAENPDKVNNLIFLFTL